MQVLIIFSIGIYVLAVVTDSIYKLHPESIRQKSERIRTTDIDAFIFQSQSEFLA